MQREFHLAKEFIRTERIANEITQEELIEEIYCLPESLSRVENGKTSPSRKKFEAFLISWEWIELSTIVMFQQMHLSYTGKSEK